MSAQLPLIDEPQDAIESGSTSGRVETLRRIVGPFLVAPAKLNADEFNKSAPTAARVPRFWQARQATQAQAPG